MRYTPENTVKVHYRVIEGTRERIQVFQGTVIKVHSGAIDGNFTVRRVAHAGGCGEDVPVQFTQASEARSRKTGSGQAGPPVLPAGSFGQGGPYQREALQLESPRPGFRVHSPFPCSGAALCSAADIGHAIR